MGRPIARWNKLGKWLSGLMVLCFFLPFFGISCDNMDVVHFSGADMVGGCKPGGLLVTAAEEGENSMGKPQTNGHAGASIDAKIDNVGREPLAIVAMAAALIVFAAAWGKAKGARALALAFAFVSLGAIGGMFVKVRGALEDQVAEQQASTKKGLGGEMQKDVKVEAGARWGLWVTAFMLLTVGGLAGAALKQGDTDDALPVATVLPGPPQVPPPMA